MILLFDSFKPIPIFRELSLDRYFLNFFSGNNFNIYSILGLTRTVVIKHLKFNDNYTYHLLF